MLSHAVMSTGQDDRNDDSNRQKTGTSPVNEGGGDTSTNIINSEEIVSISSPVEIFENRHISPALDRRRETVSYTHLTLPTTAYV